MQEEVWKDVVGFEEYFKVSNLGNVLSKRTNKILSQVTLDSGYLVINTRIGGRDGIAYSIRVHRMVAEAFLEKPSNELIEQSKSWVYNKIPVNHIDGDKKNNQVDNLEWCSYKENSRHAMETGLVPPVKQGCDVKTASLTEDQVREIRNSYIARDKQFGARALAEKYSVHHSTISRVVRKVKYKNID